MACSVQTKLHTDETTSFRERKPNFSDAEICVILKGVRELKSAIFDRNFSTRKAAFEQIALQLNEVTKVESGGKLARDWKQVRKKWCALKYTAAIDHRDKLRENGTVNGHEKKLAFKEGPYTQQVLDIMATENETKQEFLAQGNVCSDKVTPDAWPEGGDDAPSSSWEAHPTNPVKQEVLDDGFPDTADGRRDINPSQTGHKAITTSAKQCPFPKRVVSSVADLSEEECLSLVTEIDRVKDRLLAGTRFADSTDVRSLQQSWRQVAEKVNMCHDRPFRWTVRQLQHKWKELLQKADNYQSDNAHRNETAAVSSALLDRILTLKEAFSNLQFNSACEQTQTQSSSSETEEIVELNDSQQPRLCESWHTSQPKVNHVSSHKNDQKRVAIQQKERIKNFTRTELEIILSMYEANVGVLHSKKNDLNTNRKKDQFLKDLVKQLNSTVTGAECYRTLSQVQSKLRSLKIRADRQHRACNKGHISGSATAVGEKQQQQHRLREHPLDRLLRIMAAEDDKLEKVDFQEEFAQGIAGDIDGEQGKMDERSTMIQKHLDSLVDICEQLRILGVEAGAMLFEREAVLTCGSQCMKQITSHPQMPQILSDVANSAEVNQTPHPEEAWTVRMIGSPHTVTTASCHSSFLSPPTLPKTVGYHHPSQTEAADTRLPTGSTRDKQDHFVATTSASSSAGKTANIPNHYYSTFSSRKVTLSCDGKGDGDDEEQDEEERREERSNGFGEDDETKRNDESQQSSATIRKPTRVSESASTTPTNPGLLFICKVCLLKFTKLSSFMLHTQQCCHQGKEEAVVEEKRGATQTLPPKQMRKVSHPLTSSSLSSAFEERSNTSSSWLGGAERLTKNPVVVLRRMSTDASRVTVATNRIGTDGQTGAEDSEARSPWQPREEGRNEEIREEDEDTVSPHDLTSGASDADDDVLADAKVPHKHKCQDCGKVFPYPSSLKKHQATHTSKRAMQPKVDCHRCEDCGKMYRYPSCLKKHRVTHTGERLFPRPPGKHQCPDCGKVYPYPSGLKNHRAIHHNIGERPVVHKPGKHRCQDCGKVFPYPSSLKKHRITHSGEKPFTCNVCHKKFSDKRNMQCHAKRHLGTRPHQCEVCGTKFTLACSLRVHRRYHTGERPFSCEFCGEAFISKSHLTVHRRTHTGERPFLCDICGTGFIQGGHLRDHRRIHTGEKPYRCEHCGEAFQTRERLSIHRRKHTGLEPYTCSYCGKAFTQANHRTVHMRLHTGEKPYSCELCGEKFHRPDLQRIHMKKHSGIIPPSSSAFINPPPPHPHSHPRPPPFRPSIASVNPQDGRKIISRYPRILSLAVRNNVEPGSSAESCPAPRSDNPAESSVPGVNLVEAGSECEVGEGEGRTDVVVQSVAAPVTVGTALQFIPAGSDDAEGGGGASVCHFQAL